MKKENEFTKNIEKGLMAVTAYQFHSYNIDPFFPEEIAGLREKDLEVQNGSNRKNFCREKVLTIDSEDCKDMDDAVSVTKTSAGYSLAVHIADVSAYIAPGTELDKVASDRACSIYLPHMTVPMLPAVLSNNLCSLNPGVSRYTLSVLAELSEEGEILHSEICKGRIQSKVKGVYTEVNRLLSGERDKKLMDKYKEVYEELFIMEKLYISLREARIRRGSTCEGNEKPKVFLRNQEIVIQQEKRGTAENMIEEFMILANRIVAEYLYEKKLPSIFRVQEERNHLAAYQAIKLHHAELALDCYAHFTSPIRRIADLKIHQILSMHLSGMDKKEIHDIFDEALIEVCERATKRSRTADQVQGKCEQYCYKEYFRKHRKDNYTGKIVGFDRLRRPIVIMNQFYIKLIGYAISHAAIGEEYSFKVGFSPDCKEMFTYCPMKAVA